jgi:hypothetical protein
VKLNVVEHIAEGKIPGRVCEFDISYIHSKIREDIIIFFRLSAEMDCGIIPYTHTPENIQGKIEDIGYVSEIKCIEKLKDIMFEYEQVEILPFDMNMNIKAINAFAVV